MATGAILPSLGKLELNTCSLPARMNRYGYASVLPELVRDRRWRELSHEWRGGLVGSSVKEGEVLVFGTGLILTLLW